MAGRVAAFETAVGNGAVVHLVVELDGLLERFGRVVPDAVAMLATAGHLRRRLKTMPRPPRLTVQAVRFGASPGDEAGLAALRRKLSQLEPWSAVGSLAGGAVVATDPSDLPPTASGPDRLILLTASHRWFQQAVAASMEAYHIGHSKPPEHRGLPFDEVPRILEEALRIPTARPMSQGTRTGGLVSIPTTGPADARARALAALLEDPTADWLTIGEDLILYTEQPDLEDRLSEQPGVEHLSYAVHKHALVLEPTPTAGEGVLYEGHGVSLREAAEPPDSGPPDSGPPDSGPPDSGAHRAFPPPSGWAAIRRRTLQEQDPLARSPSPATLSVERYVAALQRFAPLLEDGLGGPGGSPGERLLAVVGEIVGPSAAPDLLLHQQAPAAITWTTPYRGADRDDLIALVHDLPPGDGGSEQAPAGAAAAALALADGLSSTPSTAGVLHCLRMAPEASIDRLLTASLQVEERNRLLAVVHLEGLGGLESEPRVLQVTADPRLDRRLERLRAVAGGVIGTRRAATGPARVHVCTVGNGGSPAKAMEQLLALVGSIIA